MSRPSAAVVLQENAYEIAQLSIFRPADCTNSVHKRLHGIDPQAYLWGRISYSNVCVCQNWVVRWNFHVSTIFSSASTCCVYLRANEISFLTTRLFRRREWVVGSSSSHPSRISGEHIYSPENTQSYNTTHNKRCHAATNRIMEKRWMCARWYVYVCMVEKHGENLDPDLRFMMLLSQHLCECAHVRCWDVLGWCVHNVREHRYRPRENMLETCKHDSDVCWNATRNMPRILHQHVIAFLRLAALIHEFDNIRDWHWTTHTTVGVVFVWVLLFRTLHRYRKSKLAHLT